jgi:hypothetical protein
MARTIMTSRRRKIGPYWLAERKRDIEAKKYAFALTNPPAMAALMAVAMANAMAYMTAIRRSPREARAEAREARAEAREARAEARDEAERAYQQ